MVFRLGLSSLLPCKQKVKGSWDRLAQVHSKYKKDVVGASPNYSSRTREVKIKVNKSIFTV